MAHVSGLRSPYVTVGRLVFFGRMLDKIRLHARGALPADYHDFLGQGFDGRTCRFLGIHYSDLKPVALAETDDLAVLAWCEQHGIARSDSDCVAWNNFMIKRGWRDDGATILAERLAAQGLAGRGIETFFDLIEIDEGRDPMRRRAWELRPAQAAIVMGVAGCGKTTIGSMVADRLGWRFLDADDFHPPANVAKMAAGTPLDDADRQPWLETLRDELAARLHEGESIVLGCSALKARYRATLVGKRTDIRIVYLHAPRSVLEERLQSRAGHFMKSTMLDSQLAALEPPAPDASLYADVSGPPDKVVAAISAQLLAQA